ncbi:2,3,4,5-tetrahydropyridine-2,6-dicarboxylate N-acetyltransferase [Dyadobacter sp. CECT 9623]|uniref:Serine acetyltransferase n=1 Tax=Dyadobacter linearis TaxID=2823330 RepID=A0ABM8UM18_9BACT|nr:serine acetyltransferase [Dyadobacter sp. CECT 9623]CAG5068544.1 2,3,4,5-tetrahydropyridine-2,6-dicarboxylate N-acetyltransferase [Dyadobacter sp. CECT 9623]
MITYIFQDWKSNQQNSRGRFLMVLFRIASYYSRGGIVSLLLFPYIIFYKILVNFILGTEIPHDLKAGKGLRVFHGQALVVHSNTVLGSDCTLRQSTTIGNNGSSDSCPVIGNHVDIGANVCIIGDIRIGDHVKIGAGSVVVKSIPSYSVAVGNPARIIRQTEPELA